MTNLTQIARRSNERGKGGGGGGGGQCACLREDGQPPTPLRNSWQRGHLFVQQLPHNVCHTYTAYGKSDWVTQLDWRVVIYLLFLISRDEFRRVYFGEYYTCHFGKQYICHSRKTWCATLATYQCCPSGLNKHPGTALADELDTCAPRNQVSTLVGLLAYHNGPADQLDTVSSGSTRHDGPIGSTRHRGPSGSTWHRGPSGSTWHHSPSGSLLYYGLAHRLGTTLVTTVTLELGSVLNKFREYCSQLSIALV